MLNKISSPAPSLSSHEWKFEENLNSLNDVEIILKHLLAYSTQIKVQTHYVI